jgi:hypothetical protein
MGWVWKIPQIKFDRKHRIERFQIPVYHRLIK